jgi:hypothetical protein
MCSSISGKEFDLMLISWAYHDFHASLNAPAKLYSLQTHNITIDVIH